MAAARHHKTATGMRQRAGMPLTLTAPRVRVPTAPPAKRVLDLVGAVALLTVLGLPLAAVTALLYVTRGGRPFVREAAVGLGGRPFRTWRLRTGVGDGDGDSTDTGGGTGGGLIGAALDRCALDGLPQLLNVIRGEMSLVGPRPQARTDHPERLLVRPGMTGLWQVSARSDLPWEEMALLDRHYVENHWLGMDLAILAQTPRAAYRQRVA